MRTKDLATYKRMPLVQNCALKGSKFQVPKLAGGVGVAFGRRSGSRLATHVNGHFFHNPFPVLSLL